MTEKWETLRFLLPLMCLVAPGGLSLETDVLASPCLLR